MSQKLKSKNLPPIWYFFFIYLHCEIHHESPYNLRFGPGKVLEKSLVLIHQNLWEPCVKIKWSTTFCLYNVNLWIWISGLNIIKVIRYQYNIYRQTSNISRTSMGNNIVDHSDAVGALPFGAAPTTSSFSTKHLASIYCTKTTARRDEKHLSFAIWCALYQRFDVTKECAHGLCFVVIWHCLVLPKSITVTSLALGRSYDCWLPVK